MSDEDQQRLKHSSIIGDFHGPIIQALKDITIKFRLPNFTTPTETTLEPLRGEQINAIYSPVSPLNSVAKITKLSNAQLVNLITSIKFSGKAETAANYETNGSPSVKVAAVYLRTVRAFQPWSQRGMLTLQDDFDEWRKLLINTINNRC